TLNHYGKLFNFVEEETSNKDQLNLNYGPNRDSINEILTKHDYSLRFPDSINKIIHHTEKTFQMILLTIICVCFTIFCIGIFWLVHKCFYKKENKEIKCIELKNIEKDEDLNIKTNIETKNLIQM
ncbi:hypothetical protein BpHYR1_052880, partial [Brachionus plicatilis]